MADAKTVLDFAKKHDAKILDLRFTDIPGLWHHVSYPIEQLSEARFEEGFGIDGSSIRAWAGIHESDFSRQVESQPPLGRIGQPDDIGPAAVFLASADSSYCLGIELVVDGGMTQLVNPPN